MPCGAGDLGLRRLAKTMDATATRVHLFVGEQVWPQLQLVVFLLGELYGLASCTPRLTSVGLQVQGCSPGKWQGLRYVQPVVDVRARADSGLRSGSRYADGHVTASSCPSASEHSRDRQPMWRQPRRKP